MSDRHEALKRALLRAGKEDAPPPAAKQQLLAALGLGDGAVRVTCGPASGVRRPRALPWREKSPLFASARERGSGFTGWLGAPTLVSMAAHAAILALVIYGSARAP